MKQTARVVNATPMPLPLQPAAAPDALPPVSPPAIVVDTNAVLAWLWFDDPALQPLGSAIVAGTVRWCATAAMRDEAAHVLQRAPFGGPSSRREHVLTSMDRWVAWSAAPAAALRLHCTDADDQKFIDLAVALPARWLVSRDRAVLKLARRAAPSGLAIVTPERWAALNTASPAPHTPG